MSSKFSHLSTAIRATGRSNPISINVVTIGGVGDLATGGGGAAGGGGGINLETAGGRFTPGPAGGRFAPLARGMFLGGMFLGGKCKPGTDPGRGGGAGGVGGER